MRRLVWLLLLVLLAPTAGAQAEPAPSLAVDPAFREAPAGGRANATLVFSNPLAQPIKWSLGFYSGSGVKVSYQSWEVIVPANGRERVNATLQLPNETNVTHFVAFLAQETNDSAARSARAPPLSLKATMEARAMGPAPAALAPPPAVELLVRPKLVELPAEGEARATLVVRNRGADITAPVFDVKAPPGVRVLLVNAPSALRAGEVIEIPLLLAGNLTTGAAPEGSIVLRGERAPPATFAIAVIVAPTAAAPIAAATEAAATVDERVVVAAVAAGVGAAWTTAWLTRRQWWPLLLALYTRLRPSRMLDHPVRARIVAMVQEHPGITFSELARRLDIAAGQLTHHARMLEKAGIVFSTADGQTRRFFHVAHGRSEAVAPLGERAVALVRERPRHASELARELGVSRQALHYHLKQLVADGRLVARPDGREVWLEAPTVSAAG